MTTYPIADPLRGKTVPDDGGFPADDQVMTGASPQAGVKGGVHRSAGSSFTGTLPAQSGDYAAGILVEDLPASGGPSVVVGFGSGATVTLFADQVSAYLSFGSGTGSLGSATLAAVTRAWFSVVRTGLRDFKVYRNGVLIITTSCSVDTSTSLPMPTNDPTVAHTVREHYYVNRALTADEIKACNKGEFSAELARQAIVDTHNTIVEVVDTNNRLTVSGTTFTKTAGSEVGPSTCAASSTADRLTSLPFIPGETYRITYDCSLTSGSAADLPMLIVGDYSTYVEVIGRLTPGTRVTSTFVADAGPPAPFAQFVSLNWGDIYGGTAGATQFDFTLVSVERIGTVEHFAASEVTSLGRWIGKFGTSLIPGAGITPLGPQPVQVRMEQFRYDLSSSTALDSPSGWTLVKNATGELHITPPTYANATARPVYTAVSQATQNVVDCSVNTTTGVAVLINRVTSTGTPSDATVQGHITYRE